MNVSKNTTKKELIGIRGIPEETQRYQTINFSGGENNALEFCNVMFGMPSLDALLEEFNNESMLAGVVPQ